MPYLLHTIVPNNLDFAIELHTLDTKDDYPKTTTDLFKAVQYIFHHLASRLCAGARGDIHSKPGCLSAQFPHTLEIGLFFPLSF